MVRSPEVHDDPSAGQWSRIIQASVNRRSGPVGLDGDVAVVGVGSTSGAAYLYSYGYELVGETQVLLPPAQERNAAHPVIHVSTLDHESLRLEGGLRQGSCQEQQPCRASECETTQ